MESIDNKFTDPKLDSILENKSRVSITKYKDNLMKRESANESIRFTLEQSYLKDSEIRLLDSLGIIEDYESVKEVMDQARLFSKYYGVRKNETGDALSLGVIASLGAGLFTGAIASSVAQHMFTVEPGSGILFGALFVGLTTYGLIYSGASTLPFWKKRSVAKMLTKSQEILSSYESICRDIYTQLDLDHMKFDEDELIKIDMNNNNSTADILVEIKEKCGNGIDSLRSEKFTLLPNDRKFIKRYGK